MTDDTSRDIVRGLIEEVDAFVTRFVYFEKRAQAVAVALWIVGTYVFDAFDVTPYLHIKSPEKRSGKSLLLETIEMLVRNPLFAASISAAALFRSIEARQPTVLLDEVDAIFKGRSSDEVQEGLRGILNAGFRRPGTVLRATKTGQLQEFSSFCPKALAGIGDLPDTIADRSITIALQRKPKSVSVERFRRRVVEDEAAEIRAQLTEAATSSLISHLAEQWPDLPDVLGDREQDCWELLFAVADYAGGPWPYEARAAAITLSADTQDATETLGQRLLADVKAVWGEQEKAVPTKALIDRLCKLEEAPWGSWYGDPIDSRFIAKHLKPYGVHPRALRHGAKTLRGYRSEDLAPVWDRYLHPSSVPRGETSATGATGCSPQVQETIDGPPQSATSALPPRNTGRPTHRQRDQIPALVADVAEVAERQEKAPYPTDDDAFNALMEAFDGEDVTENE